VFDWGGEAVEDCNDDCNGTAEIDSCGVCSMGNTGLPPNADQDCAGVCFGDAVVDDCGDCDGGNADQDCAGVCFGDAVIDECGDCNGDGLDMCWDESLACECIDTPPNYPDWQDNPGGFEFTATISGGLVLNDGVQQGGGGDLLAAFDADGNVRGVSVTLYPPFGPYEGTPVYEVQLRSNEAGDLLTFRYYDASEDIVLDIAETYEFVINDVFGDVMAPWELNIQTTVDLSIDLIAGWNWISFNLELEDNSTGSILGSLGDNATFITSQSSGVSTNFGAYGWYGSLAALEPTEMYKLQGNHTIHKHQSWSKHQMTD
jgi:hypothetical protein